MRFIDTDGKERHKGWIYCYTCVDESLEWYGWDYVGQTRNKNGVKARDSNHRNQSHGKYMFDRVYQAHPDAFTLDVVDEIVCETEKELIDILNDREQYYILAFGSFKDWGIGGFNLDKGGNTKGVLKETRQKLSISQKKRLEDPEERRKLSERLKAALANPEIRKKMSERNKEIANRPDVKRKVSEVQKKRYEEPDERIKQSIRSKEIRNRQEVKDKWRKSLNEYYNDPENIIKASERMKKRYTDPGERRKASEHFKRLWSNPEHRRRMSECRKGKNTKHCQLLDLESGFVYDFNTVQNASEFLHITSSVLNQYKTKPYRGRWIYIPDDRN